MLLHLGDCNFNAEKSCVIRFVRKKASIDRVDIAQLGSYYVHGVSLPFGLDLGILVDTKLKFHMHIKSIVGKSSGMSLNLLNSTLCRSREFILTLYIRHIRPIIETYVYSYVWNLEYISDMKLLENVQRRWTKRTDGFKNLIYTQ